MKERKELTLGKAVALLIVLYSIFTIVFGVFFSYIMNLVTHITGNITIQSTISVIISIILIYFSWKLGVIITFKNRTIVGFNIKKIIRCLVIFLIVISIIALISDIYTVKLDIESFYSNAFLEDKDVVSAFSEEELQKRANQNNENMMKSKQDTYKSVILMNTLSLILNLLIVNFITRKIIEKYDGVVEIEKNIQKYEE